MKPNNFSEFTFKVINDKMKFYHHRALGRTAVNLSGSVFHTHDFPEIVYVINAKGHHITENMEYELKKDMLILNSPGAHHKIKLDPDEIYDRFYICFNPEILGDADMERIYKKIKVMDCSENKMIGNIFKRADYYSQHFNDDDFSDILCILIKELFYNLVNYEDAKNVEHTTIHPLLVKAIDYINKNLFDIKSVSQVSDELYITERYLYELFKIQLKTTPKKYINEKRLHFARQEILKGEQPGEIYFKSGFSDYSTFYRSYMKYFGYSPSKEKSKNYFEKDVYTP